MAHFKLPNKKDEYDKWFEDSFKESSYTKLEKECLDTLLSQIFPAIRYCSKDVSRILAASTANINDKYCSIASEKYFDIYFNHVQGIPQNECSNFDVQLIKNNSDDYEKLTEILRNYIKNKKSASLLKLLESCSLSGVYIKKESFVPYFSAIFDLLEEFPENDYFWSLGNKSTVFRIYYFLIKNYDKDFNTRLLKNLINYSKSIFMFIYILDMDRENIEKNNLQQMITTEEGYTVLNNLLLNKIEEQKDILIKSKYCNYIWFYWKRNNKNSFQEYLDKLLSTDEGFLSLLDSLVWISKANIGTEIVIKKKFDYQSLENYLDPEICKQRLDQIKNNDDAIEKHKETIYIFYKYFDKRNDEFYM